MAFDRAAAKADGYTDEEIDQYLATKDQPLPVDQPRSRTEEQIGVVTSAIPDAVKYAAEGYAAKKLIVDPLMNAMRGPVAPPAAPAPTTFTGGANPAMDAVLSKIHPQSTPLNLAPEPPTAGNFIDRMTQLAQRYSPTARTIGAVAVPSAVAGTGAALSNQAAGQVRAMTPEQRRQFYSTPMMGAMSGDAGFASAIMNAGQQ